MIAVVAAGKGGVFHSIIEMFYQPASDIIGDTCI